MSEIYFGRDAYQGFANAYASKFGLSVHLEAGAETAVDGAGVITLPDCTKYQTAAEFRTTCASVVHEIAHILQSSHAAFAKAGGTETFRECLNVALDVADESWIDYQDKRYTRDLLYDANARSVSTIHGQFTNEPATDPYWAVLAIGIGLARTKTTARAVGGGIAFRTDYTLTSRLLPTIDSDALAEQLCKCRTGKPNRKTGLASKRKTFRTLVGIANAIEKIMEPLAPHKHQGQGQGSGQGQDRGTGLPSNLPGSLCAGEDSLPTNGQAATRSAGSNFAEGEQLPTPAQQGGQSSNVSDPRSAIVGSWAQDYDTAYDMALPPTRKAAERLATDGEAREEFTGYGTGYVAQPYRLATDGLCMGRNIVDPHSDGINIAILLDKSGSMSSAINAYAGVAEAWSSAMEEVAEVKRWAFGANVVTVESFRQFRGSAGYDGSTHTDRGLHVATDWLIGCTGRKLIVCLTDGGPSDALATQAETMRAVAQGIDVIAIGIGGQGLFGALTRTMPGAVVVNAEDSARVAIEMDGITARL